mgnify:CR=1 FL=1
MDKLDMTEMLKAIDQLADNHYKLLDICKKAIDENSIQVLIDYLKNGDKK